MPTPEQSTTPPPLRRQPAVPAPQPPHAWILGFAIVIAGLAAWFGTQRLIRLRPFHGEMTDRLLDAIAPANAYLWDHPHAADALLIVSSTLVNILATFLIVRSIFGKTFRPFVGLLILFGLRQIMQAICVLPAPPGMIWHDPGFPGGLVTYNVGNDLFFSGHTAIAVFGAIELARLDRWWWKPVGVGIAVFEIAAVLVLRAHWTIDAFAGATAAITAAVVAGPVTRWLTFLTNRLIRSANDGKP